MMTGLQSGKLIAIAMKRREIAAPEGIIDLLIEFFEWSNEAYVSGKYKFTGVEWRKDEESAGGKWQVALIDELNGKGRVTKNAIFPYERNLLDFLERFEQVKETALMTALADCESKLSEMYAVKRESGVKGIYML